jgi:MFS family permease
MFMMGNPARNAIITESVSSSKWATAIGSILSISQGVSTLTASAGGWIATVRGYSPIFYIVLVTDLLGLILLVLFIKETLEVKEKEEKTPLQSFKDFFLPEKPIIALYLFTLTKGFGHWVAYGLFYGALSSFKDFKPLQLGLMSTSYNLMWAVGSIPLGKLSDRWSRKKMLAGSIVMAFLAVLGFIVSWRPEVFILVNAISALDICFLIPSWASLVSDLVPSSRRSSVMGKLDAYGMIGSIPSSFIAGFLLEKYGFYHPLYVQVVALCVSMYFVLQIKETGKNSSQWQSDQT